MNKSVPSSLTSINRDQLGFKTLWCCSPSFKSSNTQKPDRKDVQGFIHCLLVPLVSSPCDFMSQKQRSPLCPAAVVDLLPVAKQQGNLDVSVSVCFILFISTVGFIFYFITLHPINEIKTHFQKSRGCCSNALIPFFFRDVHQPRERRQSVTISSPQITSCSVRSWSALTQSPCVVKVMGANGLEMQPT